MKSNKSLVIPGKGSKLNYFTPETKESLEFIANNEIDFVGLSYVRSENDVERVKDFFSNKTNKPKLRLDLYVGYDIIPHITERII